MEVDQEPLERLLSLLLNIIYGASQTFIPCDEYAGAWLFSQCAVHRVLCSTNRAGHSMLVLMRWFWGPPGPIHSAQGIWWQGSNLCPHTPVPVLSSQRLVDSLKASYLTLKLQIQRRSMEPFGLQLPPSPGNGSRRPRLKQASSYPKQGTRSSKCVSKAKTKGFVFRIPTRKTF